MSKDNPLPADNSPRSGWTFTRIAIAGSVLVNAGIILWLGLWWFSAHSENKTTPEPPVEGTVAPPEPEVVPLPGEKAADTVNRVLDQQFQQAQRVSDQENMKTLQTQSEKLSKVSSEESIDQLTPHFHQWLKTEKRETKPKKGTPMITERTITADNFDINTAQFYDVKRHKTKAGKIQYRAILLDAQGRTLGIDMPTEDGKKIYQLMQQMKSNPLMDKIYRQIVMPLLDKQLKPLQNQGNTKQ